MRAGYTAPVMGLRARIFLLSTGVLALLLAAEWWLVEGLRQRLRRETAAFAQEVGVAVLQDNDWLAWADAKRAADAAMAIANAVPAGQATPTIPTVPSTRIPETTARLDAMTHDFRIDMLLGTSAILLVGVAAIAFVARAVTKPLRSLSHGAAAIGAGDFGTQVAPTGEPQFDATIAAFNAMSLRLAELEHQAREAQERTHLTELGEIARGIAHGLRNPLHALGLSLTTLADPTTTAERRAELAASSRVQIERIDRTLRSFLSLSATRAEPQLQVDIAEVVQDVVMEASQTAGGEVRVACALDADRPHVRGIGTELRTALHVLVVNAVEASPPGGAVTVRVTASDDAVRVAVEDDGPGLPASVRARLFQPHVTTKAHGAGLGLFLAERIARRRYRGSLELADRDGHGVAAVLTLRNADVHA